MILIRFQDPEVEKKALGFLAKRFSFTTWASGQTLVPEPALDALTQAGIHFIIDGRAGYEQRISPLRGSTSSEVQRRPTGSG